MHVLDIWSSDDEHEGQIDLWENKEIKENQQVGKVDEKKEVVDSVEAKVEEVESYSEKAKKEEIIASV